MNKPNFTIPVIYTANNDLSKRWYIEFYYTNSLGLRVRHKIRGGINFNETLPERINAANELRESVYKQLQSGWLPGESNNEGKKAITMIDFIDEIRNNKKSFFAETTYNSFNWHINNFKSWLLASKLLYVGPNEITSKHINQFLHYLSNTKGLSNRTRNNHLLTLKSAFKTGISMFPELKMIDPCSEINPIPFRSQKNIPFSDNQFQKVIDWVRENDPLLHRFCRCFVYLGIRPNEAVKIKLGDIDFTERTIMIWARETKTGVGMKKRIFDIHWQDFEKYELYPPNYYLFTAGQNEPGKNSTSRDYFTKRFKKLKNTLGLNTYQTMYALRHTFLIMLYKSGVELKDLMKLTGHKTISALQIYLQRHLDEPGNDISDKIRIKL